MGYILFLLLIIRFGIVLSHMSGRRKDGKGGRRETDPNVDVEVEAIRW